MILEHREYRVAGQAFALADSGENTIAIMSQPATGTPGPKTTVTIFKNRPYAVAGFGPLFVLKGIYFCV